MNKIGNVRIWPQSLYGQILLVTAAALLVAQGINAAMLLAGSRGRAVVETSTMVVTRVANQVERMEATGTPLASVDELRKRPGHKGHRRSPPVTISIDAAPLAFDRFDQYPDIAQRAQEFLMQGEIPLRDVRISVGSVKLLPAELRDPQLRRWHAARFRRPGQPMPSQAVLFSARMADGKWVNATGLIRPNEPASIFALLLQTLTLYIAVMVPLALVARRIAKPLNRLTERVQRVGLAYEIEPMPQAGPGDVRQLIDAFNAMQSRVSTLLGEKDVMLGAIGHDLKTPLAALRVRVESVEDDAERDKMATTIDEMVTILDDILTFARLGKSGEVSQRTDIGALVGSITEEFPKAKLVEPDHRIIANIRPVLLRRALRNLIGNAIIYGKSASISLRSESNRLSIIIDDNGPGVSPDLVNAMFEPFARAETSRSRLTGGSGLGLTIARAIARSHNGDIRLENRDSGGLRVTLELPQD